MGPANGAPRMPSPQLGGGGSVQASAPLPQQQGGHQPNENENDGRAADAAQKGGNGAAADEAEDDEEEEVSLKQLGTLISSLSDHAATIIENNAEMVQKADWLLNTCHENAVQLRTFFEVGSQAFEMVKAKISGQTDVLEAERQAALDAKAAALEAEKARLQQETASLHQSRIKIQTNIDRYEDGLKMQATTLKQREERIIEREKRLEALAATLQRREAELQPRETELAQREAALAQKDSQVNAHRQTLLEAKANFDAWRVQGEAHLQRKLTEQYAMVEQTRKLLAAREQDVNRRAEELRQREAQVAATLQEAENLRRAASQSADGMRQVDSAIDELLAAQAAGRKRSALDAFGREQTQSPHTPSSTHPFSSPLTISIPQLASGMPQTLPPTTSASPLTSAMAFGEAPSPQLHSRGSSLNASSLASRASVFQASLASPVVAQSSGSAQSTSASLMAQMAGQLQMQRARGRWPTSASATSSPVLTPATASRTDVLSAPAAVLQPAAAQGTGAIASPAVAAAVAAAGAVPASAPDAASAPASQPDASPSASVTPAATADAQPMDTDGPSNATLANGDGANGPTARGPSGDVSVIASISPALGSTEASSAQPVDSPVAAEVTAPAQPEPETQAQQQSQQPQAQQPQAQQSRAQLPQAQPQHQAHEKQAQQPQTQAQPPQTARMQLQQMQERLRQAQPQTLDTQQHAQKAQQGQSMQQTEQSAQPEASTQQTEQPVQPEATATVANIGASEGGADRNGVDTSPSSREQTPPVIEIRTYDESRKHRERLLADLQPLTGADGQVLNPEDHLYWQHEKRPTISEALLKRIPASGLAAKPHKVAEADLTPEMIGLPPGRMQDLEEMIEDLILKWLPEDTGLTEIHNRIQALYTRIEYFFPELKRCENNWKIKALVRRQVKKLHYPNKEKKSAGKSAAKAVPAALAVSPPPAASSDSSDRAPPVTRAPQPASNSNAQQAVDASSSPALAASPLTSTPLPPPIARTSSPAGQSASDVAATATSAGASASKPSTTTPGSSLPSMAAPTPPAAPAKAGPAQSLAAHAPTGETCTFAIGSKMLTRLIKRKAGRYSCPIKGCLYSTPAIDMMRAHALACPSAAAIEAKSDGSSASSASSGPPRGT